MRRRRWAYGSASSKSVCCHLAAPTTLDITWRTSWGVPPLYPSVQCEEAEQRKEGGAEKSRFFRFATQNPNANLFFKSQKSLNSPRMSKGVDRGRGEKQRIRAKGMRGKGSPDWCRRKGWIESGTAGGGQIQEADGPVEQLPLCEESNPDAVGHAHACKEAVRQEYFKNDTADDETRSEGRMER